MAKVADYIQKNSECVKVLSKIGIVPLSITRQFQVWVYFTGTKGKLMQRYEDTATAMNVDSRTVQRAIKEMERSI